MGLWPLLWSHQHSAALPPAMRLTQGKKDRVITNAYRRPFNNWVGIPYIISCAGREEAEHSTQLKILAQSFLKSTQLYLITKYSCDILRFSKVCDSLFGALWKNVYLFMREIRKCSVTMSVSLCVLINTAIVITGINFTPLK